MDGDKTAEEIEITPEMIEAGVREFVCRVPEDGGWLGPDEDIVKAILAAGLSARSTETPI